MDNSITYDILRSLFEEQFNSDQIVFSQNILGELFLTEKTDYRNLSIELNIGLNELIEYKELSISELVSSYYHHNLQENLLLEIRELNKSDFETELSFLKSLEAGMHLRERKSIKENLKELENSIFDRELEASIVANERDELRNKFRTIEMERISIEMERKHGYAVPNESRYRASISYSNRSTFIKIAALLVLVVIPVSLYVYFQNTNIESNDSITVEKSINLNDDNNQRILMGLDWNFTFEMQLPKPKSDQLKLELLYGSAFGYVNVGITRVEFMDYTPQLDYLTESKKLLDKKTLDLDYILESESKELTIFSIIRLTHLKEKMSLQNQKIVTMLDKIKRIENTYSTDQNTLLLYNCTLFDAKEDGVTIITKEDGTQGLKRKNGLIYWLHSPEGKLVETMDEADSDFLEYEN